VDFNLGILHQAHRRIPCKIRCRETKSDTMSWSCY